MKWVRTAWIGFTYAIAILILLALFSRFDQPFETTVIALIGLVFVAVKEESARLSGVLAGEAITLGQMIIGITDLIGSTAPAEIRQGIGYDSQLLADSIQKLEERKHAIHLSPPRIVVGISLSVMAVICVYNLIWALSN
jgi:hypothetical protein